jgi:hypothetical protein
MTRRAYIDCGELLWEVGEPDADGLFEVRRGDTFGYVHPKFLVFVGGARHTDPDTAHNAYATLQHLSDKQRLVMRLLGTYGPLTDDGLSERAAQHGVNMIPTSIGKRRRELEESGLVINSGDRAPTRRGVSAILWTLTAAGRESIR